LFFNRTGQGCFCCNFMMRPAVSQSTAVFKIGWRSLNWHSADSHMSQGLQTEFVRSKTCAICQKKWSAFCIANVPWLHPLAFCLGKRCGLLQRTQSCTPKVAYWILRPDSHLI
jgi:hypothetical protein